MKGNRTNRKNSSIAMNQTRWVRLPSIYFAR